MESGGIDALIDANRKKPNPKNRVEEATEGARVLPFLAEQDMVTPQTTSITASLCTLPCRANLSADPDGAYSVRHDTTSKLLITHLKSWTILRPGLTVIVDPRRGNIRMSQPFL